MVVAEGGRGLFRFNWLSDGLLHARGTFVEPSERENGLALALWEAAIRKFRPTRIKVATTSKAGRALVCAIAKKHRSIEFEIL